jgi:hypothetical protein
MNMQDHNLLEALLTDTRNYIEPNRIIFFDRRKPSLVKHRLLVNVLWIVGLIIGIVCLLLLLYALHINSSDAVTTLSIILAILFPVYIEHIQRANLRIYAATLEKHLMAQSIFGL